MSNDLTVARPSYLAESKHEDLSRKSMVSFSKPPFIKIVQAMSKPPVKPPFKDLDIIVAPQMIKIGDSSTPFTFVPIYFFPSWACINPANMAGQLPFFREYSLDEKSTVAKKAKTFVTEDCPENPREEIKYIQILNFVIVLEDNLDISGTPVLLFFNKGEFKVGQGLIGQITIRQGNVPCYACRFRAGSNNHSGKKGTWYGLDIQNDPQPWVSEENFNRYKELHKMYHEMVQNRTIEITADSDVMDAEATVSKEF